MKVIKKSVSLAMAVLFLGGSFTACSTLNGRGAVGDSARSRSVKQNEPQTFARYLSDQTERERHRLGLGENENPWHSLHSNE